VALGALAQLEEHLLCKQGVRGSSPLSSTPTRQNTMSTKRSDSCVPDRPLALRPGGHLGAPSPSRLTTGTSEPGLRRSPTCTPSSTRPPSPGRQRTAPPRKPCQSREKRSARADAQGTTRTSRLNDKLGRQQRKQRGPAVTRADRVLPGNVLPAVPGPSVSAVARDQVPDEAGCASARSVGQSHGWIMRGPGWSCLRSIGRANRSRPMYPALRQARIRNTATMA
jgi:hypothetical protein